METYNRRGSSQYSQATSRSASSISSRSGSSGTSKDILIVYGKEYAIGPKNDTFFVQIQSRDALVAEGCSAPLENGTSREFEEEGKVVTHLGCGAMFHGRCFWSHNNKPAEEGDQYLQCPSCEKEAWSTLVAFWRPGYGRN